MANLVRARGWGTVKPPPGSTIDWGHPLARGIVACHLANAQGGFTIIDLAGTSMLRLGSTAVWQPAGISDAAGASNGAVSTAAPTALQQVSSASLMWYGVNLGVTGGSSAALYGINRNTNGAPFCDFDIAKAGSSSNTLQLEWNNGSFQSLALSTAIASNQPVVLTASLNPAAPLIVAYNNGKLDASSGTSVGAISYGADSRIALNCYSGARSRSVNAVSSLGVFWNRVLTRDEHRWLAAEPYAFIAPPGPKVFYLALGKTTSTFNQSLSVTQIQTPTIVRSVGKIVSATQTQTPTMVRSIGKTVTVTQTQTPSIVRSTGKVLNVTQTQTATMVRSVGKIVSAVQTQTATVTKSVGKILAFVQTQLASLVATKPAAVRDIDYRLGAPETSWKAGVPATSWQAGPPTS